MDNVEQFIKKHFKKSTNRNDKYHIETIYKNLESNGYNMYLEKPITSIFINNFSRIY